MASCPQIYTIPSYASAPQFGPGSAGSSTGGLGLGGRGLGGGLQGGSMGGLLGGSMGGLHGGSMGGLGGSLLGGGVNSGQLGTVSGIIPQPISQIPAAEVVIQPPTFVVTIPGPILCASCDPVVVGCNTPCTAPGSGSPGMPSAPTRGLPGGNNQQGCRGNLPLNPCSY